MTKTILSRIERYAPCGAACKWLDNQSDITKAWNTCPLGDWLLWIAGKLDVDRTLLVKSAAGCARMVLHLVPEGEDRPRLAIEAAEAWANEPNKTNKKKAAEARAGAWAAWTEGGTAMAARAAWAAVAWVEGGAAWAARADLKTADVVRSFITADMIIAKLPD
jgi:hypothetical protein